MITDSSEYHNFEGASKFRVIFGFTTGYSCESFFKNGVLTKTTVMDTMNDDVRGSSMVEWKQGKYFMVIDGEEKTWHSPVLETVGSLYYQEPAGLSRIFSERHGRYLAIQNQGNGRYNLIKPDDRVNTYQYEDGLCTKVEVDNSLTSFSFLLVK